MKESILAELNDLTSDWQEKLQEDGTYFDKFRDELTSLEPKEAFNMINDTVEFTLLQKAGFLVGECVDIMLTLAGVSKTTIVPPVLRKKLSELGLLVNSFDDVYLLTRYTELLKWYLIDQGDKQA